jgi:hypothetical protein
MSLTELLVAIAIGALVVAMAALMFQRGSASSRRLGERSEISDLRRELLDRRDCAATKATQRSRCQAGQAIRICKLGAACDAQPLIDLPQGGKGTRFGRFSLSARCVPCPTCNGGKRIEVLWGGGDQPATLDLYRGIPFGCDVL